MEVAHEDGHLGACQDEDGKHKEQETKDVVDPVVPDTVHDEVELNEDGTEGKHASHQHRRDGLEVVGLFRDLARNLVGADGVLNPLSLESKVGADHGERRRDKEPHENEGNHGSEGHGTRRASRNEEEVENNENNEDSSENGQENVNKQIHTCGDGVFYSPGHHERGQDDVHLPVLPAEHFVHAGRNVAGQRAETDVKDQHDSRERTTRRRRQEAEHGKD